MRKCLFVTPLKMGLKAHSLQANLVFLSISQVTHTHSCAHTHTHTHTHVLYVYSHTKNVNTNPHSQNATSKEKNLTQHRQYFPLSF